ncbi:hypothetical protein DFJ58DRAFT_842998 [Suillus subalutaceus]|uniref:uncharacterized protein n=1 Tax=Suillus subalutaceus TaxID=48586 RepID=UPI001B87FA49|nr:uncharacterized protein DFJ58DRAFT_842998 [Suillus subalutaceus]KAG1848062.1 hypothetical protein DFJ58DRAFT_842998 [Suillus subalutaceus]
MHDNASSGSPEMRERERNIVIFGETGSGKISFINTITQRQLARTSNDARGCTSTPECYPVAISNSKYILIDTPGLNEPPEGTVPDAKAKKLLKGLLCELMSSRSDDIGLLVYCVRREADPSTFVKAYDKFYSGICHKRIPIILVVKGWGNEQVMENWWNAHRNQCRSMHFANYPYDMASQEIDYQHIPDDVTRRDAEPSGFLRNLIAKHSDSAVDTSWFERVSGAWGDEKFYQIVMRSG